MNVILIAVIILAGYFIVDLFLKNISHIATVPSKSWSLGIGWFVVLLVINLAIVIFIPVYYYYHDDTGNTGPIGDSGRAGISGSSTAGCSNCSKNI